MKLGHYIPAYRGAMQHAVHLCAKRTARWCWENDVELLDLHSKGPVLDVNRNRAVSDATQRDCDYLLMQDADVYCPDTIAIERLLATMESHNAAVVGAAVQRRGRRRRYNCKPVHSGMTYEGQVGTGLMLIDLRAIAEVPFPLFAFRLSDKGLSVKRGEDVYFCKHVRKHGLGVVVDFTFTTRHVAEDELESFVNSDPEDGWMFTHTASELLDSLTQTPSGESADTPTVSESPVVETTAPKVSVGAAE